MPKVISRSVVVTDADNSQVPGVHVYYCLCKKLVLASSVNIDVLKKRATDQARFLPGHVQHKLSSRPGPTVYIKRNGGKERQFRSLCPNCGLLLAYRSEKDSEDVYLVDGAFMRQDEESEIQRAADQTNNTRREETGATSKYGSVSVATTTEQEEAELESRELGANYDANASVIEMLLNRGVGSNKRSGSGDQESTAKRKRGTLLN